MQVLAEICWQDALGSLIAVACATPFTADWKVSFSKAVSLALHMSKRACLFNSLKLRGTKRKKKTRKICTRWSCLKRGVDYFELNWKRQRSGKLSWTGKTYCTLSCSISCAVTVLTTSFFIVFRNKKHFKTETFLCQFSQQLLLYKWKILANFVLECRVFKWLQIVIK